MKVTAVELLNALIIIAKMLLFILAVAATVAITKIPSKLDDLNYALMRLQGKEDKSDKRYDTKHWEE